MYWCGAADLADGDLGQKGSWKKLRKLLVLTSRGAAECREADECLLSRRAAQTGRS